MERNHQCDSQTPGSCFLAQDFEFFLDNNNHLDTNYSHFYCESEIPQLSAALAGEGYFAPPSAERLSHHNHSHCNLPVSARSSVSSNSKKKEKTAKNKKPSSGANKKLSGKNKKIDALMRKIQQLESEIRILKSKNYCDKCGSREGMERVYHPASDAEDDRYFYKPNTIQKYSQVDQLRVKAPDFEKQFVKMISSSTTSEEKKKDSPLAIQRQFEGFQMQVGQSNATKTEGGMEVSGQVWIIMGLLMMLMGININGYDGTVDVYKITRQSVDYLRQQVEKSAETIVFPVFFSKIFSLEGSLGMSNEIANEGFELQGLRLESIDEGELMFEEHLNFKLKYEALIVMMEYMKQYASLS